jgi:hypothetical protein
LCQDVCSAFGANGPARRLAIDLWPCLIRNMKARLGFLLVLLAAVANVRADLTVLQTLDAPGATAKQITIFTKGDKMRIDTAPQVSTIVDGKTGDIVTLMKDQKCAVRISAEKMKAAADMLKKFNDKSDSAEPARPKPTGRKETIRAYEAEEFVVDRGRFKASYWVAPQYPDGAAILRQLQAVKSEMWNSANPNESNFRDFTALPIRTVVDAGGSRMTTELVSVKQDPLPDSMFAVPADYREVKGPEMLFPGQSAPGAATTPH